MNRHKKIIIQTVVVFAILFGANALIGFMASYKMKDNPPHCGLEQVVPCIMYSGSQISFKSGLIAPFLEVEYERYGHDDVRSIDKNIKFDWALLAQEIGITLLASYLLAYGFNKLKR